MNFLLIVSITKLYIKIFSLTPGFFFIVLHSNLSDESALVNFLVFVIILHEIVWKI